MNAQQSTFLSSGAYEIWARGFGVIEHQPETRARLKSLLSGPAESGLAVEPAHALKLLAAADRLANAAMWVVVHMTYADRVLLSGQALEAHDFKPSPQGHTGGALNMVPAYVGYLLANALSGKTRGWLMGQGHCVAAIDAVNALVGNVSQAQQDRYTLSDQGLTQLVRDFYSYAITPDGRPGVPLGSHVNVHTAGGISEGGYLGFAEIQYVHMPLPGESLAVFLSDGAFEEQRGADWAPRWWRGADSGAVLPVMILNGRRIEQRTTIIQQGGSRWLSEHLALNGFDPFEIDGHDPAAYAWAFLHMEHRLAPWLQPDAQAHYPTPLPYAIARCVKGYGFPGAGLNRAHNLPLDGNPHVDPEARAMFNQGSARLHVPLNELQQAVDVLNLHAQQSRPREAEHPLARRHPDAPVMPEPVLPAVGSMYSPMQAIDDHFVELVNVNPGLRVRVGNPDELASNKMAGTLNRLKHRVNRPEHGIDEAIDGCVITALNEEAVVGAALGNKGGLNLVVSYEAFALKMLGALRQDILFARHQRLAGQSPGWLGVPLLLTSHTWENGKNEQSHQDPGLSELLMAEMAETSRVMFPVDAATAVAAIRRVYSDRGVIAALVVPKSEMPVLLDTDTAAQACEQGFFHAAGSPAKAEVQLVAIGAYQLHEALKAADHLAKSGIHVCVSCILEPGRLRSPRDPLEAAFVHPDTTLMQHFPATCARVIVSHCRPEPLLGMLRRLDGGPRRTRALGYANAGGTFDVQGMLLANRCTWQHIEQAALSALA